MGENGRQIVLNFALLQKEFFRKMGKLSDFTKNKKVDARCVNYHFTKLPEFKLFIDNLGRWYLESIRSFGNSRILRCWKNENEKNKAYVCTHLHTFLIQRTFLSPDNACFGSVFCDSWKCYRHKNLPRSALHPGFVFQDVIFTNTLRY